jgi:hypothetical protein
MGCVNVCRAVHAAGRGARWRPPWRWRSRPGQRAQTTSEERRGKRDLQRASCKAILWGGGTAAPLQGRGGEAALPLGGAWLGSDRVW